MSATGIGGNLTTPDYNSNAWQLVRPRRCVVLWFWLSVGAIALLVVAAFAWRPWRERQMRQQFQLARQQFAREREFLEAKFLTAASSSGKPRGLRWRDCDWERAVEFARERPTGQLAALIAVTIAFEAIEGGDMEGLPAVGTLRNATAVFFYDRGHWHTTGKTVFNLNPGEAISHFQYERLQT